MRIIYSMAVLFSVSLCVWLFLNDKAAEPGALSIFHEEIDRCDVCHEPWRGVSDSMCLQCHDFEDAAALSPELRFHEAEKYCLDCHMEHRGLRGDISRVDHTLFSGKLDCTRCHMDFHEGLFGSECRECHGIQTWDVPGFRHPPKEERNCSRCHNAPYSHKDSEFWKKIERTHGEMPGNISSVDCWRCHTTHHWRHLIMSHPLGDTPDLWIVE